jgi:hypothetical protein
VRGDFMLPRAIPGQPYHYDFKEHHEVIPDHIPYVIELDEDYPNPGWINLRDNHLFIETVPDIYFSVYTLYVRIKNLPGGRSESAQLKLIVLSSKIFPASGQDNDSNIHR